MVRQRPTLWGGRGGRARQSTVTSSRPTRPIGLGWPRTHGWLQSHSETRVPCMNHGDHLTPALRPHYTRRSDITSNPLVVLVFRPRSTWVAERWFDDCPRHAIAPTAVPTRMGARTSLSSTGRLAGHDYCAAWLSHIQLAALVEAVWRLMICDNRWACISAYRG